MEYIYAALLLFRAGKAIDESSVKKVLEAAGIKAEEGRIKALVAALDGVNIEQAIKEAAVVAPVAAAPSAHAPEAKKEEKKEEKKEDAAVGLGALFG
ncbi:50S ribosomal protein P1 [Candidatus Pacearchaeota archaeon]|nr:50S ribosomal protein P1 [Candidatus Pacearchaeota archaeon]